jgi:hypothetical protein
MDTPRSKIAPRIEKSISSLEKEKFGWQVRVSASRVKR